MLENKFKTKLISELKEMFPGCIILHNNPNEIQGIPDLLILHNKNWAALEGKKSEDAPHRPNQPYYVNKLNKMSYASFIYPENKEEVLHELQSALGTLGKAAACRWIAAASQSSEKDCNNRFLTVGLVNDFIASNSSCLSALAKSNCLFINDILCFDKN